MRSKHALVDALSAMVSKAWMSPEDCNVLHEAIARLRVEGASEVTGGLRKDESASVDVRSLEERVAVLESIAVLMLRQLEGSAVYQQMVGPYARRRIHREAIAIKATRLERGPEF